MLNHFCLSSCGISVNHKERRGKKMEEKMKFRKNEGWAVREALRLLAAAGVSQSLYNEAAAAIEEREDGGYLVDDSSVGGYAVAEKTLALIKKSK